MEIQERSFDDPAPTERDNTSGNLGVSFDGSKGEDSIIDNSRAQEEDVDDKEDDYEDEERDSHDGETEEDAGEEEGEEDEDDEANETLKVGLFDAGKHEMKGKSSNVVLAPCPTTN